jgi:hypothetical protein
MSFRWDDYHAVAAGLVRERGKLAPEEACLRSAISRAYYAAFAAARNLGRDRACFTLTGTGADHRLVRNYYMTHPDRDHQRIGAELGRLLADRRNADYLDTWPANLVATAEACLRRSDNVLATLRVL